MQLSEEQLNQFIELYRAEYGAELRRDEAREAAEFIVRLVKAVDCVSEDQEAGYHEQNPHDDRIS